MLSLHIETTNNLKHLHEEILEQLGKDVISFDIQFDVGYFVALSCKTVLWILMMSKQN